MVNFGHKSDSNYNYWQVNKILQYWNPSGISVAKDLILLYLISVSQSCFEHDPQNHL